MIGYLTKNFFEFDGIECKSMKSLKTRLTVKEMMKELSHKKKLKKQNKFCRKVLLGFYERYL